MPILKDILKNIQKSTKVFYTISNLPTMPLPPVKRLQNQENNKSVNIENKKTKQLIIKNFFAETNGVKKEQATLVKPKGLTESNIPIVSNNVVAQAKNSESDDELMEAIGGLSKVDNVPLPVAQPLKASTDFQIQDYMLDPVWKSLLQGEFEKKYFTGINEFLEKEYKKGIVRPPKNLVFNAFNSTKLAQIKVVIIGQDPYHDDNQAHGLCFSVPEGIKPPPSLKNIFIELKNDIPEFERSVKTSGCLQKWTDEGVFLLNAILTVEAHKASSHSKIGWENFTDEAIRVISKNNSGCAFLLWGNYAKKKEALIDTKKHKVLTCGHPSPFSVNRFFNSKCFSQANSYLKSIGKKPINWSL